MKICLVISYLNTVGGAELQIATLGVNLKQRGHDVTVFCEDPVASDNQYLRQLRKGGVQVVTLPGIIARLAGDWFTQDRFVRGLVWLSRPALVLAAPVVALARRQAPRDAYRSVAGRWGRLLGQGLRQDRKDRLFVSLLDWRSRWQRPDIVHVFRPELTAVFDWCEQRRLVSIYYELCVPGDGDFISPATWQQRSSHLKKATMAAAISRKTVDGLRQVVGLAQPIHVIPPVFPEAPLSVPDAAKPDGDLVTVTCIARLDLEKRLDVLLVAAQNVLALRPDVRFVIAGSGPLLAPLTLLAEQLGIAGAVRFYGPFPRPDLPKIMGFTDIFALSSIYEGLPNTIIEAMAYGKPVVAPAICGIPDAVEHRVTGLLVPPERPDALASALLQLIDDRQLRVKMGRAGRLRFETGGYSSAAYLAATLKMYEQALRQPVTHAGAGA